MRANSCRAVASGIVLVLVGCMPMEQAPLVYSSSHQIGAQVSAATPSQPGLEVNLGYMGLDAAYVPVVVAKACPRAASDCTNDIYKVVAIKGTSDEGVDPALNDKLQSVTNHLAKLRDELRATSNYVEQLTEHKSDAATARGQKAQLQNEANGLQAKLTATPEAVTPEEQRRLEALAARVKTIDGLRTDVQFDREITSERDRVTDLQSQITNEEGRQRSLEDSIAALKKDNKGDAYSVYGSFDGSTNGTAQGAGLRLGKVFSTGIAAQNLTQGIRDAADVVAAQPPASVQCLNALEAAATRIADATEAQKLRNRASDCLK